jgi:DNA-binding MarR family transcriptional regulator
MTSSATPQFVDCNGLALRRAGRAVSQLYDQHLAAAGLRGTQYSVLAHLVRLGPVSINTLAAAMGMDRTTMGRNLLPLERDGLVEIVPSETDRRSKLLALTADGLKKQKLGRKHWEKAQEAFETSYGVAEAARLRALLGAVAPRLKS